MTTSITPTIPLPEIPAADLKQNQLSVFSVPLTSLRVHDAPQTILPSAAANDDLGLIGATFATNSLTAEAGDIKTTSSTRYARFAVVVPYGYDAGQTLTMRITAKTKTTIADGSVTLDLQCFKADSEGGIGSEMYAGAALSINSTTVADYDYALTATGIVAGDVLDCRIAVAYVDTATGTAVIPQVGKIELLADTRP